MQLFVTQLMFARLAAFWHEQNSRRGRNVNSVRHFASPFTPFRRVYVAIDKPFALQAAFVKIGGGRSCLLEAR